MSRRAAAHGRVSRAGYLVAVATDVGAWRVVLPVLRELDRRGVPYRAMLAEPAASIARQDGVEHLALTAATLDERVDAVLATGPTMLLLGTSVQSVVERALIRRIRDTGGARSPRSASWTRCCSSSGVSGPAWPSFRTSSPARIRRRPSRLRQAGAPAAALVVTGNPTLEEIWLTAGERNRAPMRPSVRPRRGAIHCARADCTRGG